MLVVRFRAFLLLFTALLLLGCSTTPSEDSQHVENHEESLQYESGPSDPFEGFNRVMWRFNYDYLDPYLVRPVSLAYVNYTPTPIRSGVSNFLSNLDEPSSMVNDLLMGNAEKAVTHLNRFWINSIFGIFGIFDVASAGGITKQDERAFSDVAGHYGVGNGPYFVIPAYGPATTREATDLVDGLYAPLSYLNFWGSLGKWALEGLESRAQLVSQEATLENSPDPYTFARDVYIQRRDYKAEISNQDRIDQEEEDYLDDYLDDY